MFPLMYRDTEEAIGGHRRILEALIRRDGPSARREVEEHLRSAEYETIRHMAASRG
jgi:DNA-binding GntR family transcriptional regulator